ncbi:MAG: putative sulfate exporter family transporter [Pedosphaera sp.]|nr:putative sulfate exporter family transporter [Pedosphaera sp.]
MDQKPPDYSWANYLDYMEGGGSDIITFPGAASPFKPVETKKERPIWGVLVALGVTIVAMLLSELPFWPFTIAGKHPIEPVMLAIVLGMVLSNVWALPKSLQAGIKFSVKKILPIGIVLLGARLDFFVMQRVGLRALCLSVVETVVALLLLAVLVRVLKLPGKLGTLLGVGTAICGGTAIVATAPVIEAEDEDVVVSVATVTLLGLVAMFLLPVIGHALDLTANQFGVWAGLAIHQTPQVIAAGFAYTDAAGQSAGETATIVKLARVCLLAPVVFVIGVIYAKQKAARGAAGSQKKINYLHLFPMFVLGFLGMALLKTCGLIPDVTFHGGTRLLNPGEHSFSLATGAESVSRFCIVISMAGVGLETKFAAMKQTGLKPLGAAFFAIVVIAALILGLIRVMGI